MACLSQLVGGNQSSEPRSDYQNLLRRCGVLQRLRSKVPASQRSQLCRRCEQTQPQEFSTVNWDVHCITRADLMSLILTRLYSGTWGMGSRTSHLCRLRGVNSFGGAGS